MAAVILYKCKKQYLHRWDRWHWGGLFRCRPSPAVKVAQQRQRPDQLVDRSLHCASECGLEWVHLRTSSYPALGCSVCRSAASTIAKCGQKSVNFFKKNLPQYTDALPIGNNLVTRMSRQADLSRVIWSAMVRDVKPGRRLANSTILIMHLVESSLNLSHNPRSNWTRWSELEFWEQVKQIGKWALTHHVSTTDVENKNW